MKKNLLCVRVIIPLSLLLFPFLSNAQQWVIIGNEQQIASETSSFTSIVTTTDGAITVPYVVYVESGVAKVKKFDGDNWIAVGDNVAGPTVTYTRIYIDDNGKLYVTYVDASNGNRLAIKTFNEVSQTWQPLNNDAGNLYISAETVTNNISQFATTPRSGLAFSSDNTPYVIYAEGAALNPFVKRFNGTSWETVGGGAIASQRAIGVGIAIDGSDVPFIVYINHATATSTTGNMIVYKFQNNSWQQIVVPSPIPGGSSTTGATTAIRHTCITLNAAGNPVFSYFNSSNSNRCTTIAYDKTAGTWSFLAVLSGRDITNNSLSTDASGNLFAAFTDVISNGSGRSVARVMKLTPSSTIWVEQKDFDVVLGIDEPAGNLSHTVRAGTKPYVVYTKANSNGIVTPIVRVLENTTPPPPPPPPPPDDVVNTPKQVEKLDRGLVAVRTSANQVYVGWRLYATDPSGIAFNVYRNGTKVNTDPITNSTNYIDQTDVDGTYMIKQVINGVEKNTGKSASVWAQNYLNIALDRPADGVTPAGEAYSYSPNDCSVGDLDGDGEYEVIVKWDPSNSKDNSQAGYTGDVFIDAYKLNGTRLWRIDLGRNIRAGAHYTQFMVYDFDGDGKAEMACKTADGTVDGTGVVIGDPNADYRNTSGYVLAGPEFLTMFNGLTGAAMATTNYVPARGSVAAWGDTYGNRVDRFIAAVAYVDGAHPSLIMGRGYFTRLVRVAWDWKNGQFVQRWVFDSNDPGNAAYAGQGNHQMTVGDVDGDGKDEIINGSSAINDNGKGLWANGMGHGDALHLTDMDPDRPGLELWQPYESPADNGRVGAAMVDARTGARIFTVPENSADVGRAVSANVDPRFRGNEVWAARGNLMNATGTQIGTTKPSQNFATWWDADFTRELLDGTTIAKWDYNSNTLVPLLVASDAASNNGTKANPGLSADILGDWREEVIYRTADNNNIRIYTTTDFTTHRLYTLMHDPQYRVAIAWQNSGYNQPPHPSFYIGEDMSPAPDQNITYVTDVIPPIALAKNISVTLHNGTASILPEDVDNGSHDAFDIRSLALSDSNFDCSNIGANQVTLIVTDNNGNVSTATATVTVIGEIPTAPTITVSRTDNTFTGGDDNTIFLGYGAQQLTLTASNGNASGINYSWSPSLYLSNAAIANPVFQPTIAGIFNYNVTATNSYGCISSSSVQLTVIDVRCGNHNDKVLICKNGHDQCVASPSVHAHLGNGAHLGSCEGGSAANSLIDGGIADQYFEKTALQVYPNPTYGPSNVVIQSSKSERYTLSIYDLKGSLVKLIASGELQANTSVTHHLGTNQFAKGTYVIKLVTDSEVLIKRIVIQ